MCLLFIFFLLLQNNESSGFLRDVQQKDTLNASASHTYMLQQPFSVQTYSISYGWKIRLPNVLEKSD